MRLIQTLPNMNIGGVERGVLDLAVYLKRKGMENSVVSGGGRLVEILEEYHIPHYKLPVYRKSLLALLCIRKFRRIMEKENPQIVHARSRIPAWISFFATRSSDAIFITTAHGMYKNKFFSEIMGWGKFVICPSRVVARHMKERFGVPDSKIVVINRWVDLDKFVFNEFTAQQDNNAVVTVGRISPSKGYEYLIEAFKKVVRFNPYLKLKIVGSPDKSKMRYYNYLKTLVNRYALNFNVEFTGFRSDIENVLRGARVLVAPSVIEESFGRVLVEAFACGVPVVATRVGGYNEIVEDKKEALLVDPADSSQLADAILKILDDPSFAKALTQKAREKVEKNYTMANCLKQIVEVYNLCLIQERILIIKISSLGDLILAIPSFYEIRKRYPQSKITLLTLQKYVSFVNDCPYIDEVISLDDNYKKIKNILPLAKKLRRTAFDYIIDLQNSRSSHLIAFLSLPRYSFGFKLRWGALLSKKVAYKRGLDPLSSQEQILKLLGIKFGQKQLIFWNKKSQSSLPLTGENFIGINLSASSKWRSKRWPTKNIIKLIGIIYKNLAGFRVVFFGDSSCRDYAHNIGQSVNPHPINLCGRTSLDDLPLILKKLKVFITPDTATLHLAQAVGISTIALFGPTDPERHTVKSRNLFVFCQKRACSFCYKPKCKFADESLCLEDISPHQIFSMIKNILDLEQRGVSSEKNI
ncbi:MAG: glycosyltransferase [Candidatus Omnitrophica bacterium]|nr:glycosyltransferase [Candidatus Omnitrophota bacterium]